MNFELYGGKLNYWIFPLCIMYRSVFNSRLEETYYTFSFEILRWYFAITITKNHKQ